MNVETYLDANRGKKEYKGVREDGTAWAKVVKSSKMVWLYTVTYSGCRL